MKRILSVAWLLGVGALGCSGSDAAVDGAFGSGHLRLEQACSRDSDCPATFECEAESEHGATSTFCSSIDPISPTSSGGAMCPSGYEIELEHGVSFCKPHGGSDDAAGHDVPDDHGAGGSDDGATHDVGDGHGAGGSDHSGKGTK